MSSARASVRRRASAQPDAVAISAGDRTLTCAGLCELALAWAALLKERRVEVLAVLADNSPDWVALDFGAQIARCTLVPIPGFFSFEQMRHAVSDSGAGAIAADADAAAALFGRPAREFASPSASLRLWVCEDSGSGVPLPPGTAKISYTSGTTGLPKGACLSQAAMDAVAGSLVAATRSVAPQRHLCLLPLPVLLENIAGVYAPMISGATIVMPSLRDIGWSGASGLDIEKLLRAIHDASPHSLIALPQMVGTLVAALEDGLRLPDSLRFCAVGGARVPADLLEQAASLGLPVFEGYGLTECASVVTLNTPQAQRPGSVGRALPHARVRIDEANGEILVAGSTFLGYATGERVAADEWYRTGDLGRTDDDGFVHVQGRLKNVFITSYGRNVSPDWIEPEFLGGDAVRQIAIYGESRPWNVAVVVPAAGASSDEIRAQIAGTNLRLPDYARVRDLVFAAEPFSPQNGLMTANGRTRREAVWGRYRDRIDACYDSLLHGSPRCGPHFVEEVYS